MHLREALLQAGNQIEEILKWQIGMQAANDVELRNRFAVAGGGRLEGFLEGHGVSARRVFLASKGTEAAGGHANIRGIDVAIDVEVRLVAMHALTHGIRQPADGEDVSGAEERERVVSTQTFLGQNFIFDLVKPAVVGLKGMSVKCAARK